MGSDGCESKNRCMDQGMHCRGCGFWWDKDGAFVLRPMPDARLKYAAGMMETVYGTCRSKWEYQEDGSIMYTFVIPFQAKIKAVLPNGEEYMLESGVHTIKAD